jgi:hypothetical protein
MTFYGRNRTLIIMTLNIKAFCDTWHKWHSGINYSQQNNNLPLCNVCVMIYLLFF